MDSIQDILKQKANDFDFSKADDLKLIQVELDRHFDGEAVASKINSDGTCNIIARDAAVAGTLRYTQYQIMESLKDQTTTELQKFVIRLG